jgi:basic membrane lipoprotein Med (substrate-binding protein (PBP1-ABC) superfamily)
VVIVGAAITAVVLLTSGPAPQAIAYANVSRNYRVCLLSTTKDAAETDRIWPAVQAATTRAPINAEHVTAPAGTPDQLTPYLNSLLSLHCGLIIGAGPDLVAPISTAAKRHPNQHFITSEKPPGSANISSIPREPSDLTAAIVTASHTGNSAHP